MKLKIFLVSLCFWPHLMAQVATNEGPQKSGTEREAFALLVMGPEKNILQTCADAAMELNKNLMAFTMARTAHEEVEASIRERFSYAPAHGDRLLAVWKERRQPALVANADFAHCAKEGNVQLGSIDLQFCFVVDTILATAELSRQVGGMSEDRALSQAERVFGRSVSPQWIKGITQQAYAANLEKDSDRLHRETLATCVLSTK